MIFIDFGDNINILVANPLISFEKQQIGDRTPPLDDGDGWEMGKKNDFCFLLT